MAMGMQTLKAGSLCLEPMTVAHAEAMFDVLADSEIYRYLDYPAPPSIEHLRDLYARLEKRQSPDCTETWLNWVVRKPGETPMGYVQSTVLPSGDAWVAYVLNSRHWGGGVAHAATQAMMAHLASAYDVKRFMATVEVENVRSIRLLERLEFRMATADETGARELTASERLYLK